MNIVFMYAGQGTQYFQMGKVLFDTNSTFRNWMLKGDEICQSFIGTSITQQLYDVKHLKSQVFSRTLLTHPAIFMIEYALTQVLFEKNIFPDYILGSSLGEITGMAVAGVVSFEAALQLVIEQAKILENYCPPGSMLSILENPTLYQSEDYICKRSELAAINFATHFTVSGSHDQLNEIANFLNKREIISQLLPVERAFHSALIDNAKLPFLEKIQLISLQPPSLPFISCINAGRLSEYSNEYFWQLIRLPIQFQASVNYMENENSHYYVDISPSGTLATFIKYNLSTSSQSIALTILSPFGNEENNLRNAINQVHGLSKK